MVPSINEIDRTFKRQSLHSPSQQTVRVKGFDCMMTCNCHVPIEFIGKSRGCKQVRYHAWGVLFGQHWARNCANRANWCTRQFISCPWQYLFPFWAVGPWCYFWALAFFKLGYYPAAKRHFMSLSVRAQIPIPVKNCFIL